ncbi:hypothetical protein JCM14467A_16930 [Vulcanisaeta sp. JCM 14467]
MTTVYLGANAAWDDIFIYLSIPQYKNLLPLLNKTLFLFLIKILAIIHFIITPRILRHQQRQ